MLYQLNEGVIALPEGWQDETLNAFSSPDNSGLNLVITRQPLPFGADQAEFIDSVCQQYADNLPEYQQHERRSLVVAEKNATLLDYHWISSEGQIDQLVVMLIEQNVLLSFTVSSAQGLGETQKQQMLAVIGSLQLTPTATEQ
ncbi:DcrB-related protein [Serratia microhaemolytica]|uniref:DcrB-related protein n=1 Tax=Serratia microhaemolytica TaxID=2675110 RepID=UPI000FDE84FF|nr:DcrB-related protein [Serratia microhaemolytica]